jgi:hypothetical protein
MADYPLINGIKYDWASAEVDLNGTVFLGIKELTWEESLEPGIGRGSGSAQKLFRTRGEHDSTGTLVMWTEDADELLTALGDGYGEVPFDITTTYSNPGVPTNTTKLLGCRITNKTGGGAQGTDPLEVSFDLDIIQVDENGKRMVSNALI